MIFFEKTRTEKRKDYAAYRYKWIKIARQLINFDRFVIGGGGLFFLFIDNFVGRTFCAGKQKKNLSANLNMKNGKKYYNLISQNEKCPEKRNNNKKIDLQN